MFFIGKPAGIKNRESFKGYYKYFPIFGDNWKLKPNNLAVKQGKVDSLEPLPVFHSVAIIESIDWNETITFERIKEEKQGLYVKCNFIKPCNYTKNSITFDLGDGAEILLTKEEKKIGGWL